MNLIDPIVHAHAEIQTLRRQIHAHPELGYEEHRTSELVANQLQSWGIEVQRDLGGTGVVGVVRNGTGRMIGLRADMDALPIQEANTFPHRSVNAGKMHACGHDGHTAMLLGAAKYLAQSARQARWRGAVALIFQPAEEGGGGAKRMIADGLFEKFPCDAVFGMHNWPGIPVGQFAICDGPALASSNIFDIKVNGRGAHAAMPHLGVDPVFVAVQIAQGLQSLISRVRNPLHPAVLSITMIHGGDTFNVIPESATLRGTVRTFDDAMTQMIEDGMRRIATGTAQAHGAEASVDFTWSYPPTINHDREAAFAAGVLDDIVGPDNVLRGYEPTMGAEDFAFMLKARPGAHVFIGNGDGSHRSAGHGAGPCTLHNPSFDFNDDLLPLGATYWVRLSERFLTE
jgi:hippurate hydrolase